jgi:unsaturated rhamnogalacturonyl hydrolase
MGNVMTQIKAVFSFFFLLAALPQLVCAQAGASRQNDSNPQLYLMPPQYPVPYGPMQPGQITEILHRMRAYLEASTPARIIDRQNRQEVADFSRIDRNSMLDPGAFRLISYEWGVVYSAMLSAGEASGDSRFAEYTTRRIKFIADIAPYFRTLYRADPQAENPLRSVLDPRALDDSGSMCAAMIRAARAGAGGAVRPLIDTYVNYIMAKQLRLSDGTLARNRPQPNTLWLDDLYMSVPALAEMGKLTGERRYFDDAAKQVLQFSQRMFNRSKGLYIHGWVQGMEVHPEFHWARANGWAIMAIVDLLDVLPSDHPSRPQILDLLRTHARGLAQCQSGSGFWHQLLDRSDSYLETSATAIYTYGIARGINKGWLDPMAYGPIAVLGWNAVSTKVNAQGQVEGTCVGTGMGFDPTFYYHRPTNVFAAHGYGTTILAGAEMIRLLKNFRIEVNDGAVQLYRLSTGK